MKMRNVVRRPVIKLAASLAGLSLLASCGGGDPYAGLWDGDMSTQRQVTAVVLGDGDYYMLYSQPGKPSVMGGLVQGTGDFQGATFTSADARDYNWEVFGAPGKSAPLSAKVSPRQSVTGSAGARTFTVRHTRDLDDDARIADIAGSHVGTVMFALGPRAATFNVTATGQVSTLINGCTITGVVTPRGDTEAFDLVMTFGGYPCVFPNVSFSGIAFYRQGSRQLQAAILNKTYQQAIGFSGIKQ